jgi:hypothetical protein
MKGTSTYSLVSLREILLKQKTGLLKALAAIETNIRGLDRELMKQAQAVKNWPTEADDDFISMEDVLAGKHVNQ